MKKLFLVCYDTNITKLLYDCHSEPGTRNLALCPQHPAPGTRNPALLTDCAFYAFMHNLLPMRNRSAFHQVVFPVEIESAFLGDHEFEEVDHILPEHTAGVSWDICREEGVPDDLDPIMNDGFIVLREFAVTTGGCSKVDDH